MQFPHTKKHTSQMFSFWNFLAAISLRFSAMGGGVRRSHNETGCQLYVRFIGSFQEILHVAAKMAPESTKAKIFANKNVEPEHRRGRDTWLSFYVLLIALHYSADLSHS